MRFFRTVWYLPSLVSGVAQMVLFLWVFNPQYGLANDVLGKVGIDGPGWFNDASWALPTVILMSLWTVGGAMVIYLAGLKDVPSNLYEAAAMDGAGPVRVSGATMALVDPTTGEEYGSAPVSNEHDIDNAYAAAAKAFCDWKRTTPSHRQKALLDFADEVENAAQALVEAEGRNTGKPNHVTMAEEIPPMVDQIRFFAGAARVLEGKSAGEYMEGHTSWIRREPVGVIGQVAPWNYPMMMAIWKFCPAIAAGNTVVIKPSDTTPVTTVMLAELAAKHFPPGVLNVVPVTGMTGAAVVAHPTPEMVSITGSVAAGRAVAVSAGGHLKRTHLELGGKAPVIVFADADIAAAAEGIATAGLLQRRAGLHGGDAGAGARRRWRET